MSSSLQLHRADTSRYDELDDLWRKVYGGEGSFSENPYGEDRELFYGTVDGEAAFATIVHKLNIRARGNWFTCAGLGAVATLPEYRSRKVGTFFLAELLQQAASDGFVFSSLYGFRETFYRRLGFESCGYRWQIRSDVERLPDLPQDLKVRRIESGEMMLLNDCYENFLKNFSGGCSRNSALWRRRLGTVPPSVFALGDPIEAYIWCDPSGFFENLEIGEFGWSTRRGYLNGLALMRSLGINKTSITWNEPPESPFLAQFCDERVEAKRHRPSMFRILDARKALESISCQADAELTITDEIVKENRSPIKLGSGGSLSMSPAIFTQAFLGEPSLAALVRFGLVEDSSAAHSLAQALPPVSVCHTEFY